jgi:hypothetical protein
MLSDALGQRLEYGNKSCVVSIKDHEANTMRAAQMEERKRSRVSWAKNKNKRHRHATHTYTDT